jgi:hypothetical protein
MVAENDANLANYSELMAHVGVTKALLEKEKPETDAYAQSMNDLSMYYERLVQLKSMRIQTLEIENQEGDDAHTAAKIVYKKEQRKMVYFGWAMMAASLTGLMWAFPIILNTCTDALQPYLTVDRLVLTTLLFVWGKGWLS